MRFPVQFSRSVGGGPIPALGGDGAAGTPPTGPNTTASNYLTSGCYSNQGWPAHRVAVAYRGPVGALPLPAQLWVFDRNTEAWYEVGAPITLTPNRISFFDIVALIDARFTARDQNTPTQGAIDALLVVQPAGGDPAGTYVFGMGADLTVLPV